VEPIIETRCFPCHSAGGVGDSTQDLTSYHGIAMADIVGQVGECFMPPPDAGQPTLQEREILFTWSICGRPEN
jgi:hypothetical protein